MVCCPNRVNEVRIYTFNGARFDFLYLMDEIIRRGHEKIAVVGSVNN